MIKKCITCDEIKSIKDFHKNHMSSDKKQSNCKKCCKEYNAQYRVNEKKPYQNKDGINTNPFLKMKKEILNI